MITKIELNNFRCFNKFTLDKIAPITLIAGLNNVGKSSFLESIFLFYNRNTSEIFLKLNLFRQIQNVLSSKWLWKHLFTDMNIDNDIKITFFNNNDKQSLILNKGKSFSVPSVVDIQNNELFNQKINFIDNNPLNYALQLEYSNDENCEIFHYLIVNSGIIRYPLLPININNIFIQYFSPKIQISQRELAEYVGILDLNGNKYKFIKILQLIEPRVKDLSVILMDGSNSIFLDLGLPTKLPLNLLGDGIVKIAQIALIMLVNPGVLLLIDEIEEGFHFEFFPKLWEIIGTLAIETNSQIFATTHNFECIKTAKILFADKNKRDYFRYVRFDNLNGIIKPIIFSNDNLEFAIENNIEIR
jgi:AAA15 family ATPase/GTPase